jgi:DNA-directed RNA polymerase specialized sigma24 family protein
MDPFVSEDNVTREGDLANWQAFCLAYYDPIVRAVRLLRVPEGEVEDLAHSFLLKVAERNFLETFRAFRERLEEDGRRARFRTYLYRSIQNHVRDFYRRTGPGARCHSLDPDAARSLEAEPEATLDPDALYALDVLHQAIQSLRRHCERSGKPQFWVFFEEMLLADEFRGRRGKTRAELLQAFPGLEPQKLDNSLTTTKRAFRRFVEEVIPRGLRDDVRPGERFDEWMSLLRDSSASQFNLLHLAYRVMPYFSPEMSRAASTALVVDPDRGGDPACAYQEPALVPDDDELGILLGFHLELPLTQMIDAAELMRYLPPSSPLLAIPRSGPGGGRSPSRLSRPACLLTLIDPTLEEAKALAGADLVGLLTRLKLLAKQLRHRPDHSIPEVFSQLLYTLTSVLGIVRCEVDLHTISPASLAGNIRWFLRQPWLDDRVRPLLQSGLDLLGSPASAGEHEGRGARG